MAYLKVRHRESKEFSDKKFHDNDAINDVIHYITNPTKAIHKLINGIGVNPKNAIYEMNALSTSYAQDRGVRLRHIILSFGEKELQRSRPRSAAMAYRLAYEIAQYYGWQYQIVYAVHENTDRIHIHFVMNTTSFLTGQKYRGTKQDLNEFIRWTRDVLEPYHIPVTFLRDDGDWDHLL